MWFDMTTVTKLMLTFFTETVQAPTTAPYLERSPVSVSVLKTLKPLKSRNTLRSVPLTELMKSLPACLPELSTHVNVSWHIIWRKVRTPQWGDDENSVKRIIWISALLRCFKLSRSQMSKDVLESCAGNRHLKITVVIIRCVFLYKNACCCSR